MDKNIFKNTRKWLDRVENIIKNDKDEAEYDWYMYESDLDLAKYLYSEIPGIAKVAKIICIMDGNELIKIEVK